MKPDGGANGSVLGAGGLRVLVLPGTVGANDAALGTAGVELGITGNVLGSGIRAEGGETIGVVGTNPAGVTEGDFGAGRKPAGGEKVDSFEVGTNPTGFGVGTNPDGRESGLGFGVGMNPAGVEAGYLGVIKVAADAEVCGSCFGVWEASTFGTVLSCAGPEISLSWDLSTGFTSSFSGGSSLRMRGRGSLVLPRVIKLVSPAEISSLSSFFMESCLKENTGIFTTFGTDAGSGFGGSKAGLNGSGDMAAGVVAVSSSAGTTLLTTLRTTFTTFLRVPPSKSSVSSGWLALAVVLILPLRLPLILLSPFCKGSGLKVASGGSGLLKRSGILGTSENFLVAILSLLGDGLLTRLNWGWDWISVGVSRTSWGLLARSRPLPGSRQGTDWERLLRLPSLSDYSPAGTVGVEKSVRKEHWK